jgi:hypothetical protein
VFIFMTQPLCVGTPATQAPLIPILASPMSCV